MSYQVIARKYRPQRFADVVGQEHVTQTLANAIAQNRIAHAYLFCGPRGTGKTTIARIFAKCLNCTAGPKVDFDDADERVREITDGRSLDVIEIDGASNRRIEDVRDLREAVKFVPANSKFRVYIIDEVHMLTGEAFNALLKTLEEPPAHVKFLFATTDPEKLPTTILSRCQRFDLRRIPSALIVKHLQHISKLEGVELDGAACFAIARGADGGMRDAESALDQLISFCGNKVEESDVLSMFGLTAQGQILEITRAILAGEAEPALRQLHDLAKHGKDLSRLLADLLNHFRNLLLFRVSRGDLALLEVSEAEAAGLKEQSAAISTDALTRIMEVLTDTETRLRDAASKKILVEVSLLNAIEARNAVSLDTVLKQLKQLRETAGGTAPAPAPAPVPVPVQVSTPAPATAAAAVVAPAPVAAPVAPTPVAKPVKPAPVPAAAEPTPPPSVAIPATDLPSLWTALVEAVGRASAFTKSYLVEAHPVSFDSQLLVIGFDPEFEDKRSLLDNARSHELLQTKLKELGHPRTQIKIIKADKPSDWTPAPAAPAAPTPATPAAPAASPDKPDAPAAPQKAPAKTAASADTIEAFKNDPLIKKALEVFKGRIVEVRA